MIVDVHLPAELVDHQQFADIPTEYDLHDKVVIDTRGRWEG